MRFISYFVFLCVCFLSRLEGIENPLSVVIVGGGPAGLATAIEAYHAGAHVTVIEKRSAYVRSQLVFLFDPALELLQKWEVATPSMMVVELEKNRKMGIIKLKDLEEALASRVAELSIDRIEGKFTKRFSDHIEVAVGGERRGLVYDILVGADGSHSGVREEMGVSCVSGGSSTATAMLIPFTGPSGRGEMPATHPYLDCFIRSFLLPFGRIIILQEPLRSFDAAKDSNDLIDPKRFEEAAFAFGWEKEVDLIRSGEFELLGPVSVTLQQAITFSDPSQSTLLIGDAAAVAPFLEGKGANYCFQTAGMVGAFLTKVQQEREVAYLEFNRNMQRATDALIEDCRYLLR